MPIKSAVLLGSVSRTKGYHPDPEDVKEIELRGAMSGVGWESGIQSTLWVVTVTPAKM